MIFLFVCLIWFFTSHQQSCYFWQKQIKKKNKKKNRKIWNCWSTISWWYSHFFFQMVPESSQTILLGGNVLLSHSSATVLIIVTWATTRKNLSLRFPTRSYQNQPAQLQRLAIIVKSLVARFDRILFNKQITKALISLRGCAGWSAPLLFANPQRQVFSRQGSPWCCCFHWTPLVNIYCKLSWYFLV